MSATNWRASRARGLGDRFGCANKGVQVDDVESCTLHSVHCVADDCDVQRRRCGSRNGQRHGGLVSGVGYIEIGKVGSTVNDVTILASVFPEVATDGIECGGISAYEFVISSGINFHDVFGAGCSVRRS